ncbi:TetR/AcrR family transcriptional regulator [Aneurinibacillus danicus]|jgi:AcrR family transcriptional regulator|uniref:TetR family transcriptional regulator n=1 Tax=Aneurinibacillus danicus TaxID=267746 RepID=A0A511VBJ3_9BACL|nr:TetR/AcrR family transcriptional regulator C-terminal domain-containing protein [Aneurinibacillus danicus]GEN36295.1 TetR family transcriptional regulator [Aneurinibacillus danicus]
MSQMKATQDRRINRTRQSIQEAVMFLISEKDFDEVSVTDITECANINRSTFYSHYQDKYDLLNKIVEEKLLSLTKRLRDNITHENKYKANFDVPDPFFEALFNHVAQNEEFYRIMFTRLQPAFFIDKMREAIRECYYTQFSLMRMKQKPVVPSDILLDYISSSIIGVVVKWLEGTIGYKPQYMALQLTRLFILGVYKTMEKID